MMYGQASQLPEDDPAAIESKDLRKRVRYLRRCKDLMWIRWTEEYIRSLRERHNLKHKKGKPLIKTGDVSVFPRKTTFSISRPNINLASLNWAENRPFLFDLQVAFIECRKVVIQLIYCITFPCPKTHNYRKIGFTQLFIREQKQSVLQRGVRRSVKRMVTLTLCHISEFQKILDSNYIRIGLSIYT